MVSLKHLYRTLLAGILFFAIPVGISAQNNEMEYVDENGDTVLVISEIDTTTVITCFRHMPDSLLPYLSEINRLDMLDFMDSHMKADVINRFGGLSEMTELSLSALSIRMSEALKLDMLLLDGENYPDGHLICLIETFGRDSLSLESKVRFFSPTWEYLSEPPQLSVSDLNTISSKQVQTILKRDDEILKKN